MTTSSTELALGMLSNKLEEKYQANDPLILTLEGRPKLHILSFSPLIYERYGLMRGRAPYVAGDLALRGFLTAEHPDGNGALVYLGVQANEQAYGFKLNSFDPSNRNIVNDVAQSLGFPNIWFEVD